MQILKVQRSPGQRHWIWERRLKLQTKIIIIAPCDFDIFSSWNEWLKLPIKYPDLPRHAQVCFTIWDVYGPRKAIPVGGTTVSLFGKHGY